MGSTGTGAVRDFTNPPKTAPAHDPYPDTRDHVTGRDAIDGGSVQLKPPLTSRLRLRLTPRLPLLPGATLRRRADFESPVLA
jgi:hypothetical protein